MINRRPQSRSWDLINRGVTADQSTSAISQWPNPPYGRGDQTVEKRRFVPPWPPPFRAFVRYVPADASGFEVVLSRGDDEFTVSFAGWHEPFDSPEEALRRFTFGLSERCRLRVLSRSTFDYRWTVRRAEATVGRTILRRDCWFFRRQRGFLGVPRARWTRTSRSLVRSRPPMWTLKRAASRRPLRPSHKKSPLCVSWEIAQRAN
jgi:hypothetical protein